MLGILGILLIVTIVVVLFWGKFSPAVAFILIPIGFAAVLGYNPIEINNMIHSGIGTTTNTALLFMFSIPFFFIMNDVGAFNPIVKSLIRASGGSHLRIAIFTVLLTMVAHLDGAGASTALIVIPAMLPIYKKMNMRPHVLLFIIAMSSGIMNIVPWGGPTIRAAAIIGADPSALWRTLIPIQVLGLVLSLVMAIFFGLREKKFADKAIAHYANAPQVLESAQKENEEPMLPTWRLLANWALIIGIIAVLVHGELRAHVLFMFGTAIALLLNYPTMKQQSGSLDRAAKGVLTVVIVLLASGAFVGILDNTGMMQAVGEVVLSIIPEGAGRFYNLFIGFLALPLTIFFGTDAYFFGLLPIIAEVGYALGFNPETAANILITAHNSTVFVSPLTPAMFLMIGLAGVDLKEHLKFSLPWALVIGWFYIIFAFITGII